MALVARGLLCLLGVSLLIAGSQVDAECQYELVESMPDGLELDNPAGVPVRVTHESLIEMVRQAERSVRIASFYLMLTPEEPVSEHPAAEPGRLLLEELVAAAKRGVDVEIVVDNSNKRQMTNPNDVAQLEAAGARVKRLNMRQLLGGGVMHSKFLIADGQTMYVGSSNFDWRSYTQIKEIGIAYKSCPALAQDLDKIYRTYARMSELETLPEHFDTLGLAALTNLSSPAAVDDIKVSLTGSPPAFNKDTGRSEDIDGLLRILESAKWRIDISVMNYSPQKEFARIREYWPRIDNALRRAATERNVRVRLLFSRWPNSKPLESVWYKSLNALHTPLLRGGIHVKLFQVPSFDEFQESVPYARVKHDKFMVTDNGLYIGTSNWAPDYFTNTCGVGVVMESNKPAGERGAPKIVRTMQQLFERDFYSPYAHELDDLPQ